MKWMMALLAAALGCSLHADDAGLGLCWRNIDSAAKARIAEYVETAKGWRGHVDHPKYLVRGQFFYGLERDNDIHIFYERPLLQDSSLAKFNERGHMLNPESWKRTVSVARDQRLDGFAFFPTNPGCWDLLPRSVMPGGEIPIMGEFHSGDVAKGVKHCADVAGRLLAAPNAFRINGKVVMSCYPAVGWSNSAAIDFWPKLKAEVEARYGKDRFAFMPYLWLFNFEDLNQGRITVETLERTREYLREVLRKTDGVFYWMTQILSTNPRGHDEVVVPLVKSVLAEPEFKDKFYGIGYWQGHENAYRCGGGDINSFGFRRLLATLQTIDRSSPDFSIGFEWDEQNENTHFRPTVSNGFTTQRLMRYFSDRASGRKLEPMARDVQVKDVPNLMVAYRKMVEAGDAVEVQVVNVPDGTQPEGPWTISCVWKDAEGKVVRSFEPQKLSTDECGMVAFTVSSVDLLDARVIYPELTVSAPGVAPMTFADGFWPLSLTPNRCGDMKWVRTSLRDIPKDVRGGLQVGKLNTEGVVEVRGSIAGPVNFRSIEVLEDSDSVYYYDVKDPNPNWEERVMLKLAFYANPHFWKHHSATGRITVVGASGVKLWESNPDYAKRMADGWIVNQSNKALNFLNKHYLEMSTEAAQTAVVKIELDDAFPKLDIPVKDILKHDRLTFAGPEVSQLAIARERTTYLVPEPAMVKSAEFKFAMKPWNPLTVLRLQAVDEHYRVWRGQAVVRPATSGKQIDFTVYDVVSDSPRKVTADAAQVVDLHYDFAGAVDDAYYSFGWRNLPLVSGGGINLLTYVGCGDMREYGNALGVKRANLDKYTGRDQTRAVPYREVDGSMSLKFDGCAYATLPVKVLSRYAGYELSMKLLPTELKGFEGLIDTDHLGLRFYLQDGVPKAFVALYNEYVKRGIDDPQGPRVEGPKLKLGEWNDVKLICDQRHLWIEVNGVAGEKCPCSGYMHNPAVMAVGVYLTGYHFFHGRLADLRLKLRE